MNSSNPEKLLALPDGRTLAYENAGTLISSMVVIFFPGTLSVGTASDPGPTLTSKGAHYISPTLPGYGNTSSPAHGVTYAATIASDISALIDHLYPDPSDLKLYIGGGSFGTVPAQMLYGAPFDIFPAGRYLKGLLLMGPFPPFQNDKEKGFVYTKAMSWLTYISVGPPARIIPFRLIQRTIKLVLQSKLSSQDNAEAFIRQLIFDKMGEEERELYRAWREERGYAEGQAEREFAQMNRRSIEKSWEGYLSQADVLHGDWGWGGKKLGELDEEHTAGRSVLVVTSEGDDVTPVEWAEYLATRYPNARLKRIRGGHLTALFHVEEIWKEFFGGEDI
jgi:pimeloyl-ACP methyl ester carboxylesterase